jgi:hypothetical protein
LTSSFFNAAVPTQDPYYNDPQVNGPEYDFGGDVRRPEYGCTLPETGQPAPCTVAAGLMNYLYGIGLVMPSSFKPRGQTSPNIPDFIRADNRRDDEYDQIPGLRRIDRYDGKMYLGSFWVEENSTAAQTQQNKYPFLGKNPFPEFKKNDLKVVQDSLNDAQKATAKKECDEALKKFGIDSLSALVSQYSANVNIFDGRQSTVGTNQFEGKNKRRLTLAEVLRNNKESYGAIVLDPLFTGKTGNTTFLSYYFFSPSKTGFISQQRALIIIHEAVHHFTGRDDTYFGSSRKLTEAIAEKCFPGLNAAGLLGDLVL